MSYGASQPTGFVSLHRGLALDPFSEARLPRVLARDRRSVSIHEAGHVVIAEHLKLRGRAWIMPSTNVNPRDFKLWEGSFQFRADAAHRLSVIRRQMLAVAGAVAEECWRRQYGADRDPTEWSDCLFDPEWMSLADWQLSGHEPGEPTTKLYKACESVDALLTPEGLLWPRLVLTARKLIHQGEAGRV